MAKDKDLDPTQTGQISRKWEQDFSARFRRLKGQVNRYIDGLNKRNGVYSTSTGYVFGQDYQATAEFMNFFEKEIDRILRGLTSTKDESFLDTENWIKLYIDPSYLRGLSQSRIDLNEQNVQVSLLPQVATSVNITGAAASLSTNAELFRPVHFSAIQSIYQRDYDWLKDDGKKLATSARVALTKGIQEGQGITEISKNIKKTIDIGYSRSRLIARTETSRAYKEGAINEGESLSDDLQEEIRMVWVATLDSRVRSKHLARHGKSFSFENARKLINESPWNCRCSIKPMTLDRINDDKRKEQAAKQRSRVSKKANISSKNRQ
tara:strand:+ start:14836 stop:15801 length:966 start_codon:yes stop_codon:yes gene_type:complete